MSQLSKSFTEHPASVGETWTEHLISAWTFAAQMLLFAIACFFHGLFPFLFEKTGSRGVESLYQQMITHRNRNLQQTDFPLNNNMDTPAGTS